jgi:parallel beta-helix repeat protein
MTTAEETEELAPLGLLDFTRGVGLLLVVPMLVLGVVIAAHAAQASAPRRPGDPPSMVDADATPRRMVIQRAALDTMVRAAKREKGAAHSHVVTVAHQAVLVLTPRPHPYGVRALSRIPQAAEMLSGRRMLVRIPIVVARGARLVLHSRHVRQLLLQSSPSEDASIMGLRGTIHLRGTADQPLRITSFQPGGQVPDTTIDDGRPFVLERSGTMKLRYVHADDLGFGEGTSSGVAWVGTAREPAHGVVTHSTFTHNRFGAYTFRARHMTWAYDTFDDNQAYGFDPHDFSDDFVVRDNLALRNGRHGIIFSRGCDGNVIERNTSEFNRGHGFMIDDGRSGVTSGPRRMVGSSHNLLIQNRAFGNGHSGIEIEGGQGNEVRLNRTVANFTGIRFRSQASGDIQSNDIRRSRLYGVQVESTAGQVLVRNNMATGSWSDFTADRTVRAAANHFDVVQARSSDDGRRELTGLLPRSAAFLEFRPVVTIWLVVLLVPLVAVGAKLSRTAPGLRGRR